MAYTYDAYDRRIAKVIDPDGAGPATATTERMVYDGDNIALTFDGTGIQTHRYLYGSGVDQVLADETATSVNWALVDYQGTVRDVIDSNGTVLNHIVYDSYGQVTSETNASLDFRFGYTGRERDKETGLQYNRARYYDPSTGGVISEDPIGFLASDSNLSRYISNNPVNGIDPSGLQAQFDNGFNNLGGRTIYGGGGGGGGGLGLSRIGPGGSLNGEGGDSSFRGLGSGRYFNQGGGSGSGNQLELGARGLGNNSSNNSLGSYGGNFNTNTQINSSASRNFCPLSEAPKLDGSFSIRDWNGYPSNVPKPQGPFRLLKGQEYNDARKAANTVNKAMHRADPNLKGLDIHEVHPVKFGGSPTDPKNKVSLSRAEHSPLTTFWNGLKYYLQDFTF